MANKGRPKNPENRSFGIRKVGHHLIVYDAENKVLSDAVMRLANAHHRDGVMITGLHYKALKDGEWLSV